MRIGFIFHTFSFGGHETETFNLIANAPHEFLGIAVERPLPLPTLPQDFPPIHFDFQYGVNKLAEEADVLIAWGCKDLAQYLPKNCPPVICMTKADGPWSENFCHPNAMLTPWLMANSTQAAEAWPASKRDKVKIIHDGFDPNRVIPKISRAKQRTQWGIDPQANVVGFIGRICKDKGTDKIVEAVALLPDWQAVFVGVAPTSDFANELRTLCENKIPGRYKILPWTDDPGSALNAFDVFCHPSEVEGFSNSIAEAWLAGVPTIYTAGTGAAKDLPGMGIEVSPERAPHELALAILQAQGIDTKRAQDRMKENFLVSHNVARWEEYLAEVISTKPKPRVLFLFVNALVGGVTTWFLSLQKHCKEIEFAGLVTAGKTEWVADEIKDRLQCPYVYAATQEDLAETILFTRPDVIVAWGVGKLAELLPADHPPVVLVSHGQGNSKSTESTWAQNAVVLSHKVAARCVAVSQAGVSSFPAGVDVTVISNGVELPCNPDRMEARSVLGLGADEVALGFVGRLAPDKNYLDVAKAASVLGPKYRAVFIGPREDPEAENKIKSITDRYIYLPKLAPDEAAQLFPSLDVLFLTSESEGFGLVVVEAWAHSVPVVATRVGILCEHPAAVIVPKHSSPARLAVAVERALSSGFKRTVAKARQLAETKFNAARMAGEWDKILFDVYQEKAKP